MATSKNNILGLGELEKEIMEVLWQRGSGTVREVLETLHTKRSLAYTTVMTVMARLADKELLRREALPNGSFLYVPSQSKEALYAATSKSFFKELIKYSSTVAVAQFVDVLEHTDQKELAKLKAFLQQRV